jgi:hypothetical protein
MGKFDMDRRAPTGVWDTGGIRLRSVRWHRRHAAYQNANLRVAGPSTPKPGISPAV